MTPLHLAASQVALDIVVDLLYDYDADAQAVDCAGRNAVAGQQQMGMRQLQSMSLNTDSGGREGSSRFLTRYIASLKTTLT